MSSIQVRGLRPLSGKITVQGSKNAALPVMAAALLARGITVIRNVPVIADVLCMMEILESLGCGCRFENHVMEIDATEVTGVQIPEALVGKMRSSVIVLGPLLSRMGEAWTMFPGGCVLGKRPVDLHLSAFRALGAKTMEAGGVIVAQAGRLSGNRICFRYPSVGATENALMAAVTAKGTTVLENCAREPEILELCMFLIKMGAVIRNVGGRTLVIEGKERLFPCEYELGADRICGGTYLAAAVIAGGEIAVSGVWPEALREPLRGMERMGARVSVDERNREIRLAMSERPRPVMLATGPYPDFPTDLQSPFLAAASVAAGVSRIEENVFDARFKTAGELRKLGAKIHIRGRTAHVTGNWPLMPALVESPDLRGGAALVLAALAADGESLVGGCEHIARGYEDIVRDLCELGAEVSWV